MILWLLVIAAVGVAGYLRLAPSDPARWDVPVTVDHDEDLKGGAVRVIPGDEGTLARVHAAALALPRTIVLSGTPAQGRITYVTRSKVMGFPDYTTVELVDGQVRMFARLRFGQSDFGVNRARLERLVRAAQG